MTRELTDEQLLAIWTGNDERFLRPVLGNKKIISYARAIIAADRALRVPMTDEQKIYQAAYRQGLEDAANVCESRQTPGTGSVAILNGSADAIRSLK